MKITKMFFVHFFKKNIDFSFSKSILTYKKSLSLICFILILLSVHGQLEHKTWMVGGNASFNTDKNSSDDRRATNISFSPNIGYFIWDKLPIGLKTDYTYQTYNINGVTSHQVNIGPFMRYYLLEKENLFNVFVEGDYAYGKYKTSGIYSISNGKLSKYSFLAGPVIYFNSSVGLEFTIGYYNNRDLTQKTTDSGLEMSLGFQIHLQK